MTIMQSYTIRFLLFFSVGVLATMIAPNASAQKAGLFPARTPVPIITLFPAQNLNSFATYSKKGRRWRVHKDSNRVFTLNDGFLRVSGNKVLYLKTKREFTNYHLVVEYKWLNAQSPRDSGVFVNTTQKSGDVMAFECNIVASDSKAVLFGAWGSGASRQIIVDKKKLMGGVPKTEGVELEKPIGQWNQMRIICDRGKVFFGINGRKIVTGENAVPRSGAIMFQHNRGDIQFGRVQLVDYDALSVSDAESARRWQEKVFRE